MLLRDETQALPEQLIGTISSGLHIIWAGRGLSIVHEAWQ